MSGISRRPFLASALTLIGVTAVGGGAYELGLFRKHYAAYGDLLGALDDPEMAKRVGAAVLAEMPGFDAAKMATDLRVRMSGKSLSDVLANDLQEGHVVEANGWVLPETLTLLCALASKSG